MWGFAVIYISHRRGKLHTDHKFKIGNTVHEVIKERGPLICSTFCTKIKS